MSKKQDALVTRLRFPEFKDNWRFVNGDDLFEPIVDKDHNSDLPILAITQEHGAIPRDKIDYSVSVTDKSLESYKVVRAGDFIISLRSFQGGIEYSNYDGICSPAYIILRKKTNIENDFYLHYFKTTKYIADLNKNLEGIRDGKMVSYKQFSDILLPLPSPNEQKKIADCLSSLDELITAETEKLEALKVHKKGLMQQLFPAEGETVPKLRFKEFKRVGGWVEKSLNEISPIIFDGTHQTPSYTEAGVPFFSVENIVSGNKNKFISREDYLLATIKNKPGKGDVLITRIGKIGFSKVVDWDYEFSIYVTLAVVKQSSSFNSNYLHYYFQSDRYQNEIMSRSLLNAVPCKINMDELRKTKVLLPPDEEKKEQVKIADCLSSIDNKIDAHSKKIETLKLHKKGLMQQLFPSVVT